MHYLTLAVLLWNLKLFYWNSHLLYNIFFFLLQMVIWCFSLGVVLSRWVCFLLFLLLSLVNLLHQIDLTLLHPDLLNWWSECAWSRFTLPYCVQLHCFGRWKSVPWCWNQWEIHWSSAGWIQNGETSICLRWNVSL